MNRIFFYLLIACLFCMMTGVAGAQQQNASDSGRTFHPLRNAVRSEFQFNGYTNHWQDVYRDWYRYGGLFKMAVDDIEKNILQGKADAAADMGLPGLLMEEGFISGLLSDPFQEMPDPSAGDLESALKSGNVLAFVHAGSALGKKLDSKLSAGFFRPFSLGSHQYGARDLVRINAYFLENDGRKLFVVSSADTAAVIRAKKLIRQTLEVVRKYDLKKGLFGAKTLMKSVTCSPGHYLDVIGRGMNQGNTWFVFDGYLDYMAGEEMQNWMEMVNLPVVTDVGFKPVYGCGDWKGLQTQRMFTRESWIRFARERGGYVFRPVYAPAADPYHYHGYFAAEGNKEQIDSERVPFVMDVRGYSSSLLDDMIPGNMVVFLPKGVQFTRASLWEAIMERREVGIFEKGGMTGPAYFRNALEMLLLDRIFIARYFGSRLDIETEVDGYDMRVTIRNTGPEPVTGTWSLALPDGLDVSGPVSSRINLRSAASEVLHFRLLPGLKNTGRANPVAFGIRWNGREKHTVALLDLPPVISVHHLLYGYTPMVNYPVAIHNFTDKSEFPVRVQVYLQDRSENIVFETQKTCTVPTGSHGNLLFKLKMPPGNYQVKVQALGAEFVSQLGVGEPSGMPVLYESDLDGDGINEFVMENDSVKVTLLTTGARVIEYIVKSRNDNVLFKKWPEKVVDDKRPNRKWNYYPYGGFEDFLGQASMETHKVYHGEVLKAAGDFVRVRMWADFFGSTIEKVFTLYGDTPLLEVRFALNFRRPEASLLGPQPIVELGEKFGTEDVFTLPERDGRREYRITPEKRWGKIFYLTEGWHAGYDTGADVSLVGAFPIKQPLFMHMWFNEPGNKDTHYYYAEFQPWTPIYSGTTTYFTYYLWGNAGYWENALSRLRGMNLISEW